MQIDRCHYDLFIEFIYVCQPVMLFVFILKIIQSVHRIKKLSAVCF